MSVSLGLILDTTRQGLPALRARRAELETAAAAAPTPPEFMAAFRRPTLALIAEVKRRSPSAGSINETLDPVARAVGYAAAGAAAISVLTDGPFFGGSLDDLRAVAASVSVPVLRKDFILAEEQLLEARVAGAAAALLIVRALGAERLAALARTARDLGLGTLVEVHTAAELDVAVEAGADVIGVNSRDLDTFRIDIEAAWRLVARVPSDRIAVAESGMATLADAERAAAAGADAVLVGTALSSAPEPMALAAGIAGLVRRGR
ncbi:MAG TPA: indole-3-glycerol-phosphate synthase [Gemmatimonadales bacterium]|nr:indole-3-glycerol-phosphate synthase [Gemmatimonadales bacterium]